MYLLYIIYTRPYCKEPGTIFVSLDGTFVSQVPDTTARNTIIWI
jgi:hypothetical protein